MGAKYLTIARAAGTGARGERDQLVDVVEALIRTRSHRAAIFFAAGEPEQVGVERLQHIGVAPEPRVADYRAAVRGLG